MASDRWVDVTVDAILAETDLAFLCVIDGEEVWLPKSQIHHADDYRIGELDEDMEITRFIAEEKGLV